MVNVLSITFLHQIGCDMVKNREYYVEKVLFKRTVDDRVEYLIRWQGWEDEHNTWEPIENLTNCQDKVQEYEEELARGSSNEINLTSAPSSPIMPTPSTSDLPTTDLTTDVHDSSTIRVPSTNNLPTTYDENADVSMEETPSAIDDSEHPKVETLEVTNGSGPLNDIPGSSLVRDLKTENGVGPPETEVTESNTAQKSRKKLNLSFRIPEVNGFDRGLVAEKVLGITNNGELMFVMKWVGLDRPELVPFNVARYQCPPVVIEFLQRHITWFT